jgi:tetratricopeptide (TPR) repeat protein
MYGNRRMETARSMEQLVGELNELERQGRYERALLLISTLTGQLGQREDVVLFKAYLLSQLQRWEEAVEALRPLGNQSEAKDLQRRCIEQQVEFLEALGDFQASAKVRGALLLDAPNDANGVVNQGIAYGMADNYEQAIKCFDQAIQLDSRCAPAWYNKGVALFEQGQIRTALSCFDTLIAANRSHAGAWHYRALCLLAEAKNIAIPWSRSAKLEEARQCLGKALRIDPNLQDARECLKQFEG